jgi:hypothetical protein
MAVLLFKDRGWEVATAAWSAGSKGGSSIEICYRWGADGTSFSFTSNATGNVRVTLNISMADFVKRLSRSGGVVDLRDLA